MTYKMKDAKITHLSLVDKGANGVPFAIIKAAGKNAIQKQVQIAKVDDTQHIVIGVVYQPDVEDVHGDMMDAVEIEKAAHLFMENQHTYNIDKQHDLDADKGYVVESYIAPCDMEIGDQVIAKGSWVAGVKVTDDGAWKKSKRVTLQDFQCLAWVSVRKSRMKRKFPRDCFTTSRKLSMQPCLRSSKGL